MESCAARQQLQQQLVERGSSCTSRERHQNGESAEQSSSPTRVWSRPRHLPLDDDGPAFKQLPTATARVWTRPRHVPLDGAAFVHDLQSKTNDSCNGQPSSSTSSDSSSSAASTPVRERHQTGESAGQPLSPTRVWSRPRHLSFDDDGPAFNQPPPATPLVWTRPRHVPLDGAAFEHDLQSRMNENCKPNIGDPSASRSPQHVSLVLLKFDSAVNFGSIKLATPMSCPWKKSAVTFLTYVAELVTLYAAIAFFEITALSK
jgi:hypothetical protein